jgi:transcriptional regulator with GAF, ATPase, and Fis domain
MLPVNLEPPAREVQISKRPATLEATEREHIHNVLGQTGWVVEGPRGAAKILGLHPNTLRSRMKKLGIRRTSHDPS